MHKNVQKGDYTNPDDPDRPQYDNIFQSLIVLLGYAIGLGNLWRFPYLVGKHGGGAFLIPYVLSLCFVASPTYLMEFILGQKFQKSAVGAFQAIHPGAGGLGYAAVVMVAFVGSYYNVLLAWALQYMYQSFNSTLPWTEIKNINGTVVSNSTIYFNEHVIKYQGLGTEGSASLVWPLAILLGVVYVNVFFALCRGIHDTGRVAYFTVGAPIVLIVILFFRVIFLEGAGEGIAYYLTPRMEHLLDIRTWADALGQIIFSLSPGMGTAIALSSYNPKSTNIFRMNLIVSLANSAFSVFGGFVIFSVIGNLAHLSDQSVEQVASTGGFKLAFVVFAKGVTYLPFPQLWAFLFFFMLLSLGLDSSFAWMESINTLIRDKAVAMGYSPSSAKMTAGGCVVFYLMGLIYTTRGGLNWLDIVDHFACTYCLLLIVCLEVSFVGLCYGFERLRDDLKEMTGVTLPRFYIWCWRVVPVFTGVLWFLYFIDDLRNPYEGYPWYGQLVGYVVFLLIMSTVVAPYILHRMGVDLWDKIGIKKTPALAQPFITDIDETTL